MWTWNSARVCAMHVNVLACECVRKVHGRVHTGAQMRVIVCGGGECVRMYDYAYVSAHVLCGDVCAKVHTCAEPQAAAHLRGSGNAGSAGKVIHTNNSAEHLPSQG